MRGERLSVRLPRRTVPVWVTEPMGFEMPRRMASTPAMKVVATAPMPGRRIPSLPVAGRISAVFPDLPDCVSDMVAPSIGLQGLAQGLVLTPGDAADFGS